MTSHMTSHNTTVTERTKLLLSDTLNMKRRTLLNIAIITSIRCFTYGDIECYVCEAEKDELICKNPTAASVRAKAVFCSVDGNNRLCSTTSYKRKCVGGGTHAIVMLLSHIESK